MTWRMRWLRSYTRRIADEGLQKEIEDLAETVSNIDIPDAVT